MILFHTQYQLLRRRLYRSTLPRSSNAKSMENKVSPALALRLARMEGAHMNGNEAMPLWFAAVVSA